MVKETSFRTFHLAVSTRNDRSSKELVAGVVAEMLKYIQFLDLLTPDSLSRVPRCFR